MADSATSTVADAGKDIKVEDIEDIIEVDDFEKLGLKKSENNEDIEEAKPIDPVKDDDSIVILKEKGDDKKDSKSATIFVASEEIAKLEEELEDDDDEFEDETLGERLWGLTEMFPEKLRNVTWTLGTSSVKCASGLYQFSRSALWIVATSVIILAAPVLIENEKAQLDELNRQQQRQILLGPSASMPGSPGMPTGLAPPHPR